MCLLQAVQAFTLTPGLAAAHVLALAQLSAAGAAKSNDGWTAGVLAACERHLGAFVDAFSRGDASGAAAADRQTTTAIFTAGEVRGYFLPLMRCSVRSNCLGISGLCRAFMGPSMPGCQGEVLSSGVFFRWCC